MWTPTEGPHHSTSSHIISVSLFLSFSLHLFCSHRPSGAVFSFVSFSLSFCCSCFFFHFFFSLFLFLLFLLGHLSSLVHDVCAADARIQCARSLRLRCRCRWIVSVALFLARSSAWAEMTSVIGRTSVHDGSSQQPESRISMVPRTCRDPRSLFFFDRVCHWAHPSLPEMRLSS